MKTRFLATTTATVLAAACLLHAPLAHAQDDAPPPPPAGETGGPGGPGGGGGDQNREDRREQWRQRMAEYMKNTLKASDDEWSVIQPLIEKVRDKQRVANGSPFGGGFGGPGGPGGWGGPGGPGGGGRRGGNNNARAEGSPSQNGGGNNNNGGDRRRDDRNRGGTPETQALRTTLENENANTTDIKAKLQAVRDSRKQAATELASARDDLRKVLNLRQEAILTLAGILD